MDGSATMESPEVLRIHLGRGTNGELMSGATVDACLAFLAGSDLTIVDLDGPPPELHPRFFDLVILVRALRRRLVHRCNLAVAAQPEYAHLPDFLAEHRVDVVAALPGRPAATPGALDLLQALRRFNAAGYGQPGSGLILDLVVPSPVEGESSIASSLEAHGVRWSGLHVVPRAPVLPDAGLVEELQRLCGSLHPARVLAVPCRWALSVDWDGSLSDGTTPLGRNIRELMLPPAPRGAWSSEEAASPA
ncbi:MAG TPA: hypothetical protein VN914_03835 [Polyangia bacterium]|nr:hypothetical protein [Polyangia bacterium]